MTDIHAIADVEQYEPDEAEDKEEKEEKAKKSAATKLVEIAEARYQFGVSTEGEAFAVPKNGPKVVVTLRGNRSSLRGQLAREYFRLTGKAAPQQALADALLVIEGAAQETEPQPLYLRVANVDGNIWLDLGDNTGKAVKITPDGWTVEDQAPVLFKRTSLMAPLSVPEDGSLDNLWDRLNVTESDKPLVMAWLVSTLFPDIAHPVLTFLGEQGTGKTTAQRTLVGTLDPSPVPTRKPPRDAESWVTAAAGSWVVGLDNLSDVPAWLSDSICRAVTGDGDVRRKLYTDGEHAVFAFRRCVILNSIDLGAMRGDLAERMLPIHLELIPEEERVGDTEWAPWEKVHPGILGALLRVGAGVAGVFPFVRLETKPRMADFATVLAAVDRVLGTNGLHTYLERQNSLASESLTGDPLIAAIEYECPNGFEGTASELLERVTPDKPAKGWPANPRTLTQRLHRHAPSMRRAGWKVSDDGGANHQKVVRWDIRPPKRDKPERARNSYPQSPQSPQSEENQELTRGETAGQAAGLRVGAGQRGSDCGEEKQPIPAGKDAANQEVMPAAGHAGQENGLSLDEDEERAAFLEYEGGLPREEAEREAGVSSEIDDEELAALSGF